MSKVLWLFNISLWKLGISLISKVILSNDGLQFHQYQQNRQLPLTLTIEYKKDHDTWR
jgi:hypothetical protein